MNKQTNEYKGTEVTGLRSPLEDSAPRVQDGIHMLAKRLQAWSGHRRVLRQERKLIFYRWMLMDS